MTAYGLKRRGGRSYVAGVDWDSGRTLTSTDRREASTFVERAAAVDFAKAHGLTPADWTIVRFV